MIDEANQTPGAGRPGLAPLIVGLVLLGGLAAYCAANFAVTNEITHFLASGDDARKGRLARALAESDLTRALVLTLDVVSDAPPDLDAVARAGAALEQALVADPEVAWVRAAAMPDLERAFYELYFPRRLALLSPTPDEDLPARLSDEGLRAAARELKRQLSLPTAPLVKRLAPEDPLLAFKAHLERLEAGNQGGLRLHGGRFLTPDGRAAVLFVGTRGAPFDTARSGPLLARLDAHVARLAAEQGATLRLERSGVHPFAVATERSIKADVQRISTLSTVAVVLLFLFLFRSVRAVLVSGLPVVAGLVGAAAVGLTLFGRLHGLTVAFGATLIGVCIDYPIHVMTYHALAPASVGASAALRHAWPGLRLAAATTVVGLSGLAYTSFPGLREVAVFTTVGVITALAATRWLVPPLLPPDSDPSPLQRALARACGRAYGWLRAHPRAAVAPAALAAALCAVGLPRVRWTDDVAALQRLDPVLLAQEERVRERVSRVDGGRLVVARGADLETALRRGEAAAARLDLLVASGALKGFRAVRALVPSRDVQARALAHLADPTLPGRLLAAFEAEGFKPERLQPAIEALRAPPAPVTFDEVARSPLADLVRPFRATLDGEEATLLYLVGSDLPKVEAALADLEGVDVFDQRGWMAQAYGEYRTRTVRLVGVGVLAIFALVGLRHRRPARTAAAVLPALLATATTISLFGLAGAEVHLMHLVSLLLVLCMGVDYGVFLAEQGDADDVDATLLAIALSCSTTVLAFGLLAWSSAPALRAIGLTVGTGVLLSLVLAPVAQALRRRASG